MEAEGSGSGLGSLPFLLYPECGSAQWPIVDYRALLGLKYANKRWYKQDLVPYAILDFTVFIVRAFDTCLARCYSRS